MRLAEIDGPVVKLELQGACGTCPSSSMTMKMGLERKLKERIPEIAEVIQTIPSAPGKKHISYKLFLFKNNYPDALPVRSYDRGSGKDSR